VKFVSPTYGVFNNVNDVTVNELPLKSGQSSLFTSLSYRNVDYVI